MRVISFITQKMEVSNYLRKFKLLLDYVFEGKVVLNENTTEKLLKLLEDRSDNSELRTIFIFYHTTDSLERVCKLKHL